MIGKHIEPKNEIARAFTKEHGKDFAVFGVNPIRMVSIHTGQSLVVEKRESNLYVNGVLFCNDKWEECNDKEEG